jgi:tRNA 2-thiouridine synthesizing protein A
MGLLFSSDLQNNARVFKANTCSNQAILNKEFIMSDIACNMELDCKGMNCPLPILKTKKAIDSLESGQVLKMIATDPGSVKDMASWASRTGHELIGHTEAGEVHTYFIKKK